MRRSACAHLAWLAYMWEETGAGVMKAYLRLWIGRHVGGRVESGSWFLAKAKHQVDNYWESKLLSSIFPLFPSPLTPALPPLCSITLSLFTLLLRNGQQKQEHTLILTIFPSNTSLARNYKPPASLGSNTLYPFLSASRHLPH